MADHSLGDRIRAIREARGLSQSALADAMGRSRASVANMEQGRQKPSLEALAGLARGLDVTAGVLLGTEPMPPLPVRPTTILDLHYQVTCSVCGPLGQWSDRAEADQVRKEHSMPHEPEETTRDR